MSTASAFEADVDTADYQPTFDEAGEPLSATTFVVVDLETTGASARTCGITEIGAVKTRGGEVIGEFQTLIDPGMDIPPMIVSLTGITHAMVTGAPRIEQVLPSFLEFLGEAVLVAHNAPFDTGFLKAACREHGYRWPGNQVVDTVTLARRATTKEEAPNKKLSTLARVFGTRVTPNHRALEDARATSEILHGMLERMAAWGITHRADLAALRNPIPERLRRKATMADKVPARPGAYVFRGPRGERLYVGTSKNLRSRVKSYFTTAEQRRGIRDMLELAVAVDAFPTSTELEANVLELRLIAEHRPRYNRRSARPERTAWIRVTDETYPRLSIVRSATGTDATVGPMRGAGAAQDAVEALHSLGGVRTCTPRLPKAPRAGARACLLKDLGQCSAPCVAGEASGYDKAATELRDALTQDLGPVVTGLSSRIADLAERLEYERAAELRDGLGSLVGGVAESQRLAALRACALVAARPVGGGWDIVAVAGGRLVGSAHARSGLWDAANALIEDARAEPPADALVEEQQLIADWLDAPGVRLFHVDGDWAQPVRGAGRHLRWIDAIRADRGLVAEVERR